ncbi:hypothetical protein GNZ25_19645 [Burkholderia thailandensis]|nr:hypothetical protein [Burkholderia thailandensis]NBD05560.1 hypothetical protein [Burkholderia thailandensis]NBJ18894.1 hypothetical protein [Burkholderia thailandensis]NOK50623.1 hypothetical protein [Burkholderia thailandensis]
MSRGRGRGIGDGLGEIVSAMRGHACASALRCASGDEIARVALAAIALPPARRLFVDRVGGGGDGECRGDRRRGVGRGALPAARKRRSGVARHACRCRGSACGAGVGRSFARADVRNRKPGIRAKPRLGTRSTQGASQERGRNRKRPVPKSSRAAVASRSAGGVGQIGNAGRDAARAGAQCECR